MRIGTKTKDVGNESALQSHFLCVFFADPMTLSTYLLYNDYIFDPRIIIELHLDENHKIGQEK